jgi:hypothetical protein
MGQWPRLEEVEHLHSMLALEERDELLQCLLAAVPRGGDPMVEVLEQILLCHTTDEVLEAPKG